MQEDFHESESESARVHTISMHQNYPTEHPKLPIMTKIPHVSMFGGFHHQLNVQIPTEN